MTRRAGMPKPFVPVLCTLLCAVGFAFGLAADETVVAPSPLGAKSAETEETKKEVTFTRVKDLEDNVRFWQRVYAVWSMNEIAFHDTSDFDMVYRVVKVPGKGKKENGVTRGGAVRAAKAELLKALKSLNKKRPKNADNLTGVEKEVFENLKDIKHSDKYRRTKGLRMQNGLRERFQRGFVAAGAWEPDMRARLKRAGHSEDIIALAYVESLMDLTAISHAGAFGPWQFMRPTAKEYMQVHAVLDERSDPIIATDAAAKYLNQARKEVGPWPAAITSYNVGRAGMRRGMKAAGSSDFGVVLKKYHAKSFGFSARNYYSSFLAVLDVVRNPEKFFPGVKRAAPWRFDVVRLPFPVLATQLYKAKAIDKDVLATFNPALTEAARTGGAVLPRGLPLRVTKGERDRFYRAVLSFTAKERGKARGHVRAWHKANGKQSVRRIARLFGVNPEGLALRNKVDVDATPARGTKLAIPSTAVRYSLFPEAVNVPVPPPPAS